MEKKDNFGSDRERAALSRDKSHARKREMAGKIVEKAKGGKDRKLGSWTRENTKSLHGWSDEKHHKAVNEARYRVTGKFGNND